MPEVWFFVQAVIATVWAWFLANQWVVPVASVVVIVMMVVEVVMRPTTDEEEISDGD